MKSSEFSLQTDDGLELQGWLLKPDNPCDAAVCLVHGLGEHCGRYQQLAENFARAGLALITFDLRGHGCSQGRQGHAPNYAALLSDIGLLLKEARSRFPGAPRFLYGHSLGGNLVIDYALKRRPPIAGLIASAPLLRLANTPPAWKAGLIRTLNALHLQPALRSGMEQAALSRNPEIVKAYRNDPLVHDRITPALAETMINEGRWCLEHAEKLSLPLLLMHGGADRITSPEASSDFAERTNRCTLKIWPESYHELHNEPNRDELFAVVQSWILQHIYS